MTDVIRRQQKSDVVISVSPAQYMHAGDNAKQQFHEERGNAVRQ
jgi:hypothetical protein